MVQIAKLFTPVKSMQPEEARDYIAAHPEGEYLILDVRQPWEYEEAHIPGAQLLPLPDLPATYQILDPEKPTIVHCATGGRSRAAAQMLSGFGFKEVYNLAGGIKAYQGQKATGPREMNLDLVRGDESAAEITSLACGMEKALQFFYETMQARTQDPGLQNLFLDLARVEQLHRERLLRVYQQLAPGDRGVAACSGEAAPGNLEGGFHAQEFLEQNESYLDTAPHVLDLAMMLETQALDLYLRLGDRCVDQAAKTILFAIADEEKVHLARLGRLLEEKLSAGG